METTNEPLKMETLLPWAVRWTARRVRGAQQYEIDGFTPVESREAAERWAAEMAASADYVGFEWTLEAQYPQPLKTTKHD